MTCNPIEHTDAPTIRVIWGARNIGRVIGRSESQTHYMLISGEIPGAMKRGGKWCITEAKLLAAFGVEGTEAA